MNANELCGSLGVQAAELEAWLVEGLPCRDSGSERYFEPALVSAWLIDRGYAEGERDAADLVLATQREAAEWIGVSHDTLARGWRARGMPGAPGRYSAREITRWLAQRYAQGSGAESDTLQARRVAETRKIEADANLRELRLTMQQKQLCSRERVQLLFSEIATRTRDILMRIPSELLPMLPQEHAQAISQEVETKVRGALELLCRRLKEIPEIAGVGPDGKVEDDDS